MSAALYLGDCRELLRWLPDSSVDAIVTDPPYELGFMGHGWDASGIAFDRLVWCEALRVLKPGGHVVAYGAARTYHWLACAVELAGFEIRDMVPWLQGQGMPHGIDVSKAIDKAAGAEREIIGRHRNVGKALRGPRDATGSHIWTGQKVGAPATPEAAQWSGWNTQLAPGHEPAVLARKPLSEPTVAANVLRWGTGALNVDACRLEGKPRETGTRSEGCSVSGRPSLYGGSSRSSQIARDLLNRVHDVGRWPPNVTLSEAAAGRLDAMVGKRQGGMHVRHNRGTDSRARGKHKPHTPTGHRDASGPSEFFYTAKAATREREQGCEHLRWARSDDGGFVPWEPGLELLVDHRGRPIGNPHPTVKPEALMRRNVRMVTPPMAYVDGRPTGQPGLVLDLFMGSGTTGVAAVREGFRFLGSDMTPWAYTIATARIRWSQGRGADLASVETAGRAIQGSLF